MTKMIRHWMLIIINCSCLFSVPVFAATSTSTFNVTATVNAACSVSASNLAFGIYNPTLAASLNISTSMNVICTNGSAYTVGLDAGTGSGATVTNRLMTRISGGTDTIAYSLYQNAGLTTVWGQTIGTNTVAGTGSGIAQPITVYGSIFASNLTSVPPASYSDTITVTVTY
jgi:spore coat protein U-like protein